MRQVTAYEAHAVYADFDGMAPNTKHIAILATKELAIALCKLLGNQDPTEGLLADEDDNYGVRIVKDGVLYGIGLPTVDGYCHCRSFQTEPVLIRNPEDAANSVREALDRFFEPTETTEDEDDSEEDCP